jgi:hypothetical protein
VRLRANRPRDAWHQLPRCSVHRRCAGVHELSEK